MVGLWGALPVPIHPGAASSFRTLRAHWEAVVPHTTMGRFRLAIPALSRGSSFSLDPADAAGKIFGSASASARVFIGLVAAAKGENIFGQRFRAGPVHHGVCSSTAPALVSLRVGLFAGILFWP